MFDEPLKHSSKLVLMGGDISQRSLSFAKAYGKLVYLKNTNTDGNQSLSLITDEARWAKTAQRRPGDVLCGGKQLQDARQQSELEQSLQPRAGPQ